MSTRAAGSASSSRQLLAFGAVGIAACSVHYLVASALVPWAVPPLLANCGGFACAFLVSLNGHEKWTFPAPGRPRARAARRFLAIALGGFAVNETAYWALLAYTALPYRAALAVVLVAVAGLTFVLARFWAFEDSRRARPICGRRGV